MSPPFQLRYYPSLQLDEVYSPLLDRWRGVGFPHPNRLIVDALKRSIEKDGMRNPLTIEWFDPLDDRNQTNPTWAVRIGNNRLIAMLELGQSEAPALVIVPHNDVMTPLSGTYEVLPVDSALALFSADHPWWHSYILRDFYPTCVPRCA